MSKFVSLVGEQPAAIAVTLQTWNKHFGAPSEVILLATSATKRIAEKLVDVFKELPCTIMPISESLQPQKGKPPPHEVIRQLNIDEPIVFYADPGLKFQVVTTVTSLPEHSTFLHSDSRHLYVCSQTVGKERWAQFSLQNLGLSLLLELYQLEPVYVAPHVALKDYLRATRSQISRERFVEGLRFKNADSPTIDLAYESAGRLYGLIIVFGNEKRKEAREIQRISLHGLRPDLTVLSPHKDVLERARVVRCQAINSKTEDGSEAFRKWVLGARLSPGREIALFTEGELINFRGLGGGGPPLVVCMGNDPGATLTSICTHTPQKVKIFYDGKTPAIKETIRRLRKFGGNLPVGEVELVPTDHLGRGIGEALRDLTGNGERIKVDITPGSKAQGCTLARMANVELWSLRTDLARAECLTRDHKPLPLVAPAIKTQSLMQGGKLKRDGIPAGAIGKYRWLFDLATTFLAAWIEEHPKPSGRLADQSRLECAGKGSFSITGRTMEVIWKSKRQRQDLPFPLHGGLWFELVVASALQRAGADEIRIGVKWDWPIGIEFVRPQHVAKGKSSDRTRIEKIDPDDAFRDEIDVIARFGHRFVAVECKAGQKVVVEEMANDTEAKARQGIGRFCVPILVWPWMKAEEVKQSLEARTGTVLFDIKTIADISLLRSRLKAAFRSRSTTQVAD